MKYSFDVNTSGKKMLLHLLQDPEVREEIVSIIEAADIQHECSLDEDRINDLFVESLKEATFTVEYDG